MAMGLRRKKSKAEDERNGSNIPSLSMMIFFFHFRCWLPYTHKDEGHQIDGNVINPFFS